MIVSSAFAGKRYAILGLARSGMAALECLHASGAELLAWDNREELRESVADKAIIADPLTSDLRGYDAIVVSPGVPLNGQPISRKAAEDGVQIIGDIELFAQARPSLPPHRVVGITGTNGKSTTTALVHHILQSAGIPTLMGGNIGVPILSQEPLPEGGVYVLELSSYQIDLTMSLESPPVRHVVSQSHGNFCQQRRKDPIGSPLPARSRPDPEYCRYQRCRAGGAGRLAFAARPP